MIDTVHSSDRSRDRLDASLAAETPPQVVWRSHVPEGACELKFLVDSEKAAAIRDWARRRLQPDPHSAGEPGDGYFVSTLYLDTPEFDIFRRTPVGRDGKYRVRRYGAAEVVWIERKSKADGIVRKQRTSIDDREIEPRLTGPADQEWEGGWFRESLERFALRPVCQVTYQRLASVGETPLGPVRLTLDSDLRGRAAADWTVPAGVPAERPLIEGHSVLELKFRGTAPALFKELIQDLRLHVGRFSKYRQAVRHCVAGAPVPTPEERAHA